MATYIALLRGINVGGHKKVAMSDLRNFAVDLGFNDVQTLLQTGNLVFRGPSRASAGLERLLESEAEKRLGLSTLFVARTATEWQEIIEHNPFAAEAKRDPSHLVVMFLKDAPQAKAVAALRATSKGPEIIEAWGRELYVVYPAGIARSRLTASLMEAKLGTSGTGRNWNTVLKLSALAERNRPTVGQSL